jgi:hypothetical protein
MKIFKLIFFREPSCFRRSSLGEKIGDDELQFTSKAAYNPKALGLGLDVERGERLIALGAAVAIPGKRPVERE